eukprot:UN08327
MANSSKNADMKHSLRRTQQMIRDAIQQTSDVDSHMLTQTQNLEQILGIHKLIDVETKKGKGIIKTLKSRAFWDKHLYKLVFIIYLIVVFYIITKHVSHFFYRIYDWICWTLSFGLFWMPGFNYICSGYCSSPNNMNMTDFDEQQFKPEL